MKRSVRFLVAMLLLGAAAATAAATEGDTWDRSRLRFPELREVQIPAVERVRLANGLVLYMLEDHEYPTVEGRVLLRAGGMLDPEGKVGLGELTGTVLRTGGSARHPGDELDQMLENRGASIEFNIGSSEANGSFWCLKENASDVLSILADLLRRPAFPEEKLSLAKTETRRVIAGRNDEPMDILFREMGAVVYGKDHPFARVPEYATLDAIDRGDLVEFHRAYFHPDRLYLTIWGDFDAKKIRKEVEVLFGDWKASGSPPPGLPPLPQGAGGKLFHAEKAGMTNAWVVGGHLGIRADHPDYAAMTVLGELLGGGFASRLFNEIRTKRGLAYAAGANSGTSVPRPGVFFAYAGTRSDSALVVLDLIREEVRRVTEEPVTEEELAYAKDTILNSYVFKYASKGEVAARMAYFDFYGYPEDFTARYPDEVREVAVASLLGAAQRNIHPQALNFLVVGVEKDFAQPLASLGPYEKIDLTIPDPPVREEIPAATAESLERGRALLERAAQATGGAAAWASIRDMTQDADLDVQVQGMSLTINVRSISAGEDRDYASQKLPFGEVLLARVGDVGWRKTPQEVGDLAPDEIAELKQDREREFQRLFSNIESRSAQRLEPADLDGKSCETVLITDGGGERLFLYIDPETGLPARMRFRGRSPQGAPAEVVRIFDDYRPAGPVLVPFTIQMIYDGEPFATARVKAVTVNGGVDPALFEKPGS